MKKTRIVLGFALVAAVLVSAPEPLLSVSKKDIALDLLRRYSPTGLYIIDEYMKAPTSFTIGGSSMTVSRTDFGIYVEGSRAAEIVKSLNTTVHETCHGYTSTMALVYQQQSGAPADGQFLCYYVGGTQAVPVRVTKVFRTQEMAKTFTKSQKSYRFNTYVNSSSADLGSQVHGAYGLMDELNAYYHGTRTSLNLLPYYKNELPLSSTTWNAFFQDVNGTYYAGLEFTLYIAKYLQYAKAKYPDVFAGIVGNQAFRLAYSRISANWRALIQEYFATKEEIYNSLRAAGYKVNETGNMLMITDPSGRGTGTGNFMDVYAQLQKELEDPEMQSMLAMISQ
ncbi:MAG: hypothetical protein EPN93_10365 [Spirochaetes bacterium]|nr:MAG: hypothetical protein EPN93_10365 [Spirochaetota bacterium]